MVELERPAVTVQSNSGSAGKRKTLILTLYIDSHDVWSKLCRKHVLVLMSLVFSPAYACACAYAYVLVNRSQTSVTLSLFKRLYASPQ